MRSKEGLAVSAVVSVANDCILEFSFLDGMVGLDATK